MGNAPKKQDPSKTYSRLLPQLPVVFTSDVVKTRSDIDRDGKFTVNLSGDYTIVIYLRSEYSQIRLLYSGCIAYEKIIKFISTKVMVAELTDCLIEIKNLYNKNRSVAKVSVQSTAKINKSDSNSKVAVGSSPINEGQFLNNLLLNSDDLCRKKNHHRCDSPKHNEGPHQAGSDNSHHYKKHASQNSDHKSDQHSNNYENINNTKLDNPKYDTDKHNTHKLDSPKHDTHKHVEPWYQSSSDHNYGNHTNNSNYWNQSSYGHGSGNDYGSSHQSTYGHGSGNDYGSGSNDHSSGSYDHGSGSYDHGGSSYDHGSSNYDHGSSSYDHGSSFD
jgi:hypothetical protein